MIAQPAGRRPSHPDAPAVGEVVVRRDRWDEWIAERAEACCLQTWAWGDLKARFGWEPVRLAVTRHGRIVAGAQVLLRRLPLGTFAYVPRGPLLDWSDHAAWPALASLLDGLARERGAFCVKLEPPCSAASADSALAAAGYRRGSSVQPRSTLVVDLTVGPAALWSRLTPRVRYNVRLALRRGVRVVDGAAADVGAFYALLRETSSRAGFAIHDRGYYEAVWDQMGRDGRARLAVAEQDGRALAAAITLFAGRRAFHLYAASGTSGRHLKPNDLLHWEVLRRAQADGCESYDLWGIPDEVGRALEEGIAPPADGRGGLWGVYRFKSGFGGRPVRYAGAFDRVYVPWRYWLWRWLQPAGRWPGSLMRRQ